MCFAAALAIEKDAPLIKGDNEVTTYRQIARLLGISASTVFIA
jgi:hypothetical protein